MKKTAIALLLAGISAGAGAQTMYDAFNYSKSNYEGTARTVAMGNAFTALGGDIGAVSINPAGSAVARYSQVSVSPGVSISSNTATGTDQAWFGKNLRTSLARFSMPNFGFTVNFETPRISGMKNWSMGFAVNRSDTYLDDMMAAGTNMNTSNIAGLIPLLPGQDESTAPDNEYIGITENEFLVTDDNGSYWEMEQGGPIDQTFARRTTGSKYDYVFNWAANFSDRVFVGVNLGIISMNYSHQYYIRETAQDPSFFKTGFNYLKYSYGYDVSGTGVYGKFGILVTPFAGLRLGAAIQTPTSMTIRESWYMAAEQNSETVGSGKESSPEGEYSYNLVSPFRFNVGAAYTFGSVGLISLDYEMCDYSGMQFNEIGTNDNSAFDAVNEDIRTFMGISHEFRAGAEVKPIPELAIRAGYGFITSAIPSDVYYENQYLWERTEGNVQNYSLGLGYSSNGSFFADAAVRLTKYADTFIRPYEYYTYDNAWNQDIDTSVQTPEIWSRRMLWNVILTIGFRF